MSYETVLLPKFSPDGTIILAKEQLHNLYRSQGPGVYQQIKI